MLIVIRTLEGSAGYQTGYVWRNSGAQLVRLKHIHLILRITSYGLEAQ